MYGGKEMQDGLKLAHYKLAPNATIHQVTRLQGGAAAAVAVAAR